MYDYRVQVRLFSGYVIWAQITADSIGEAISIARSLYAGQGTIGVVQRA